MAARVMMFGGQGRRAARLCLRCTATKKLGTSVVLDNRVGHIGICVALNDHELDRDHPPAPCGSPRAEAGSVALGRVALPLHAASAARSWPKSTAAAVPESPSRRPSSSPHLAIMMVAMLLRATPAAAASAAARAEEPHPSARAGRPPRPAHRLCRRARGTAPRRAARRAPSLPPPTPSLSRSPTPRPPPAHLPAARLNRRHPGRALPARAQCGGHAAHHGILRAEQFIVQTARGRAPAARPAAPVREHHRHTSYTQWLRAHPPPRTSRWWTTSPSARATSGWGTPSSSTSRRATAPFQSTRMPTSIVRCLSSTWARVALCSASRSTTQTATAGPAPRCPTALPPSPPDQVGASRTADGWLTCPCLLRWARATRICCAGTGGPILPHGLGHDRCRHAGRLATGQEHRPGVLQLGLQRQRMGADLLRRLLPMQPRAPAAVLWRSRSGGRRPVGGMGSRRHGAWRTTTTASATAPRSALRRRWLCRLQHEPRQSGWGVRGCRRRDVLREALRCRACLPCVRVARTAHGAPLRLEWHVLPLRQGRVRSVAEQVKDLVGGVVGRKPASKQVARCA